MIWKRNLMEIQNKTKYRKNRTYKPGYSISYPIACTPSEVSDQPAHPRSLIRVFAVRLQTLDPWLSSECHVKTHLRLRSCAGWSVFAERTCFYENTPISKYRKFHLKNPWKCSDKKLLFFYISVQNIDYGYSLDPPRRGGSNEFPQSMFLSKNKNNNVYPTKPQFYYIKVGFKGVKII